MTREQYFNQMIKAWEMAIKQKFLDPIQASLQSLMVPPSQEKPPIALSTGHAEQALATFHQMQHFFELSNFIEHHVFCFLKCFRANLQPDDPANYYMEREWRVIGNVSFELSSVRRVLLPSAFATRFRADFPGYAGQLNFSDHEAA